MKTMKTIGFVVRRRGDRPDVGCLAVRETMNGFWLFDTNANPRWVPARTIEDIEQLVDRGEQEGMP